MTRRTLAITPETLRWAIDQAGLSVDEVASRSHIKPDILQVWIKGPATPTEGQLRRLAEALRRPASVLLLPSPPERVTIPLALRHTSGATERALGPDEIRQARRARRMQRLVHWISSARQVKDYAMPLLTPGQDAGLAGEIARDWLGMSIEEQLTWSTGKEAFEAWRTALESKGLLVLQLPLGSQGVRGFSLYDEKAPVVAVNTGENYQARSFTLFHELAHLMSRTESVCSERVGSGRTGINIERLCEEVASAALMPASAVKSQVAQAPPNRSEFELVRWMADAFKTSLRATAVALIAQRLVSRSVYQEIEEKAPILDRQKGFARGRGGQRAPEKRRLELGYRALGMVVDALQSDLLTERDARDYLRLDGPEIDDLVEELAGSR